MVPTSGMRMLSPLGSRCLANDLAATCHCGVPAGAGMHVVTRPGQGLCWLIAPSFASRFGPSSGKSCESCLAGMNIEHGEQAFLSRNTVLKHLLLKADIWPEKM